jgi:hypothetical protein
MHLWIHGKSPQVQDFAMHPTITNRHVSLFGVATHHRRSRPHAYPITLRSLTAIGLPYTLLGVLTVLRLVINIFAHVARRCVSAKVFCWDTGDCAIASPTILPRHSITRYNVTSADEHYQQEHMGRDRHFSNTPRATSVRQLVH